MGFNANVQSGLTANGLSITTARTKTADQQLIIDEVIASGATDYGILAAIDVSNVQAFAMWSDRNLTIETNNAGSPANTINLLAGVPYIWEAGGYETFKLTTDVTQLFITNASGAAANFG